MKGRLFTPEEQARSRESYRQRRDRAFWTLARVDGDCWVWTGSRNTPYGAREGYGILFRHGRVVYAHRRAYELVKGPIPEGLEVLHKCDNPPCINPAHLRVGTHAENMAEMAARGRGSNQFIARRSA